MAVTAALNALAPLDAAAKAASEAITIFYEDNPGAYHTQAYQDLMNTSNAAYKSRDLAEEKYFEAVRRRNVLRWNDASPLHLCARAGWEEREKPKTQQQAAGQQPPTPPPPPELSAWARAARASAAECARELLGAGADPQGRDACDRSALHWAARSGNPGLCRVLLLEAGPSLPRAESLLRLQSTGDGRVPLHDAVASGSLETVACLLDCLRQRFIQLSHATATLEGRRNLSAGAALCLCAKDALGRSPLRLAVTAGRADMVSLILYSAHLLSFATAVLSCDEMAQPLCCAARRGDVACIRAILAQTPAECLRRVLGQRDCNGCAPLYLAARKGSAAAVAALLAPRAATGCISSTVALALQLERKPATAFVIGADGMHVQRASGRDCCSALCIALRRRRAEGCVPLLLHAGASVFETGVCSCNHESDCTPFDHCVGRAQRMAVLLAASDAAAARHAEAAVTLPLLVAQAAEQCAEAERVFASHCGELERLALVEWRAADAAVRELLLPRAAPSPGRKRRRLAAAAGAGVAAAEADGPQAGGAAPPLHLPGAAGAEEELLSVMARARSALEAAAERWTDMALSIRTMMNARKAAADAVQAAAEETSRLGEGQAAVASALSVVAVADAAQPIDDDDDDGEGAWNSDMEADDSDYGEHEGDWETTELPHSGDDGEMTRKERERVEETKQWESRWWC